MEYNSMDALKEAAANGDTYAFEIISDPNNHIADIQEIADKGDHWAQMLMGTLLTEKHRINSKTFLKGIKYYNLSAKQGNECAEYHMGWYCEQTKQYDRAFYWYKLSATHGYPLAMNNLGICYLNGIGTKANDFRAHNWIFKAALRGERLAIKNLVKFYLTYVLPLILFVGIIILGVRGCIAGHLK